MEELTLKDGEAIPAWHRGVCKSLKTEAPFSFLTYLYIATRLYWVATIELNSFLLFYHFSCKLFLYIFTNLTLRYMASLMAQTVKNSPAMREIWVRSWAGKISWRRARQPIPAWKIPMDRKQPGQSMELQRLTWLRDWALSTYQLLTGSSSEVLLLAPVSPRKAGVEKVKSAPLVPLGSRAGGSPGGSVTPDCSASSEWEWVLFHLWALGGDCTASSSTFGYSLYSYSLRGHVFLLTAWFTCLQKINAILGYLYPLNLFLACKRDCWVVFSMSNKTKEAESRSLSFWASLSVEGRAWIRWA